MAATYTATNALDYAKRMVHRLPIDDSETKLSILNNAANILHMHGPWRWSVGTLAAITLTDETQDYDFTDPTDLLRLEKAEIRRGDDTTQEEIQELEIVHSLPVDVANGNIPRRISLVDADTIRVAPAPNGYPAGEFPKLHIWYKLVNTVITDGNAGTASTLLFPDEWFWVYRELVLLEAMRFAQDSRVGSAQTDSRGNVAYTGQWGVARAALTEMSQREIPLLRVDGGSK